MHLHLGIDATGLPQDLECHHLFVEDWMDTEAEQNVLIASIPTVRTHSDVHYTPLRKV